AFFGLRRKAAFRIGAPLRTKKSLKPLIFNGLRQIVYFHATIDTKERKVETLGKGTQIRAVWERMGSENIPQ
ncbi:MAG: hypothetical protein RR413_06705, partial [Christensenellaceae bacterium]